jgi:DNA-binding IclR family transcriptional regulator
MKNQNSSNDFKVHSLERGLVILEYLAQNPKSISLKALSAGVGFMPPTTHRILSALKKRGYIVQDNGKNYKISLKLFELGQNIIKHLSLRQEALPILESLANDTGETAYLIVMDNDEALCLERIDGHHFVKILFLNVGGKMPLYIGAGPRVLLAYQSESEIKRIVGNISFKRWTENTIRNKKQLLKDLKEIRSKGYALSFEDVTEGAAAVGCPVRNWEGKVIATISISGLSNHFTGDNLLKLVEIVKSAAEKLASRMRIDI